MRTKLATYALAGTLGLTGAALMTPAVSYAATGDSGTIATSLKDALAGLVTDGTLTQAQADEVATVLQEARPMHGPGHAPGLGHRGAGLEAAAEALGMTTDELRAAAQDGRTLAELADEKGVAQDDLVAKMAAAAKERMADAVADGRLTQEQADERAAVLETRITESLDEVHAGRGPGGPGRGGHGPMGGAGS